MGIVQHVYYNIYYQYYLGLIGSTLRNQMKFRKMCVGTLETAPNAYSAFLLFLGSSTEWMLGSTPPAAMVAPLISLFSSSSLRTASWM